VNGAAVPTKTARGPYIARSPSTNASPSDQSVGTKLAEARRSRGWTLTQLSEASGVAVGTLSKVETGKSGASFETVSRVARALALRFDDVLGPSAPRFASGRRSITRAGDGVKFGFANYSYVIPCNDLVSKAMIPLIMTIIARDLMPREKWAAHAGEEYIHVLSGAIELHTEFYELVRLEAGDSAYIDSEMKHAFVNVGEGEARMLSVCLTDSLDALFGSRRPQMPSRGQPS
jgi:mannose-6-phosphate isomerase-like protein (cupin superfamily)